MPLGCASMFWSVCQGALSRSAIQWWFALEGSKLPLCIPSVLEETSHNILGVVKMV